jgi:hypothetical protein
MSVTHVRSDEAIDSAGFRTPAMKLEGVVIPVSDPDCARRYRESIP